MSGVVPIRDTSWNGLVLEFEASEVLADEQTPFQRVRFFRSHQFGLVLMLDNAVMVTERDEFVYHEMLTHVPMLAHPNPRRVLVIGGGDLGTLRECLRYPTVEEAHVCEIDGRVVELSRRYLPWAEPAARDARTRITIGDGFEFLSRPESAGRFDVILCDLTDAVGMAAQPQSARLFTGTFFSLVKHALAPDGIVCGQSECVYVERPFIVKMHRELQREFREVANYVATIPTYAGFLWCFYIASDRPNPKRDFRAKTYQELRRTGGFRYYTKAIHEACFALPAELADALAEAADA
jgi:spermidine synthase